MRAGSLAFLIVAMLMAVSTSEGAAQPAPRIRIEAFDFGFRPSVVTFDVGRPVTLVFVNTGRISHSVASLYLNDQEIRATGSFAEGFFEPDHWRYFQSPAGQQFELTFTPKSGPRSGQVVFVCRVGNGSHAAAGMAGVFILRR